MKSFNLQWDKIKEKYDESMIKSKKLPQFYDFYNSGKDFQNVYEPAEDTFLMIDAIYLDKEAILVQIKNKLENNSEKNFSSVEVGCGNSLVSATLIQLIKDLMLNHNISERNYNHHCLDINKDAIKLTQNLMRSCNFEECVNVVESDLFGYFEKNDFDVKFDIIVFNPPYVTTDNDEYTLALEKKDISAAWAGGKYGSEVIFKFINKIHNYISYPDSVIYLLLSEENEYEKVKSLMKEIYNFECEVI